jgi:hypothetical protein
MVTHIVTTTSLPKFVLNIDMLKKKETIAQSKSQLHLSPQHLLLGSGYSNHHPLSTPFPQNLRTQVHPPPTAPDAPKRDSRIGPNDDSGDEIHGPVRVALTTQTGNPTSRPTGVSVTPHGRHFPPSSGSSEVAPHLSPSISSSSASLFLLQIKSKSTKSDTINKWHRFRNAKLALW